MDPLQQMLLAQRYQHTLTDLLDELRDDPEAIELFVEFHPEMWDDLAEQGYAALGLCQHRQAAAIFEFLLEYYPDEVAYHAAYADALCGVRSYLDAAIHYDRAVTLAPEVPDGYYYLAELYMMFRHPAFAVGALEEMAEYTAPSHCLADELPMRLAYAREACEQMAPAIGAEGVLR